MEKKERKDDQTNSSPHDSQRNLEQQRVDKAPGPERSKQEGVTPQDLKGKKVDADPSQESDRPAW